MPHTALRDVYFYTAHLQVCSAHKQPGSYVLVTNHLLSIFQDKVRDTEHKHSQIVMTQEGLITLL